MTASSSNKRYGRQSSLRRPPVEKGRWAAKGTKPLPEQSSVMHIISVMVIHLCRKVLFIETKVKITLYCFALFFGSIIFDFLPAPKSYLSQKDNVLNLYFVKIGWAWLLSIVGTFVYLTSSTYGCGKTAIIQQHMGRLFTGTVLWYVVTRWLFSYVEAWTGTCVGKAAHEEKWLCITSGFHWHTFDISGHAFMLVYMNLIIVEEAQAIVGWESVREMIFHEEHHRRSEQTPSGSDQTADYSASYGTSSTQTDGNGEQDMPLRMLTGAEFFILKDHYDVYTPYIRLIFIMMTWLSIACDVLLACTIVYFHTMPQKVVGGAMAILCWYLTYRCLFKDQWPGLPGEGALFRYQGKEKMKECSHTKKIPPVITKDHQQVPMFMGMPLYGAVRKEEKPQRQASTDDAVEERNQDVRNNLQGSSSVSTKPHKRATSSTRR